MEPACRQAGRLCEVKRARPDQDADGDCETGSTIATMRYDGTGRRVVKAITNAADWNATYVYYHDGQRMIETRNGSNQVLKQHVWGLRYIDELVQIAHNQDPPNADTGTVTENLCERQFYVCQDSSVLRGATRR